MRTRLSKRINLNPEDFSSFAYCPYLKSKTQSTSSIEEMNTFERCVTKAIKETESNCLLSGGDIVPRKILRRWDNIWWPEVTKNNIDFEDAQKQSIKASKIFADYCKYDISGYMYPTAGVDIESQVSLGHHILRAKTDIIKVDLTIKNRNIVLVNFTNKRLSARDMALDIGIQSIIYAFCDKMNLVLGPKENISYTSISINSRNDNLSISTVVFRKENLKSIEKTMKHIEHGIYKGVDYMNRWNCEVCRKCQIFKL